MKKLDKRSNTNLIVVEPKEGERTLLSSNEGGIRSPSLDFLDTSSEELTDDMILRSLAGIIGDIYLDKLYGYKENEKSSDILSSFNQGTGRGRK